MGIEKWSRSTRLTVYVIGGVLTVAFMIAYVSGITYLMASCEERALCSNEERSFVELASLALLAAVVFPLNRVFTRTLRIRDYDDLASAPPQTATSHVQRGILAQTELSFGQSLIAGNVRSVDASRHCFTVGELPLRCWGGYALRKGWIRRGNWAVVVYQRLRGLNFVLGFWNGESPVRGVGGLIHAFFLALAGAGASMVAMMGAGHLIWLLPICTMLFLVSATYLLLQFYAKKSLRDFINNTGSS
jgi:hypothetical protein